MVSKSHKPVKQCLGCLLNTGDACAAFPYPAVQWQHGDCEGYNNVVLIKKYRSEYIGDGKHERKRQRAEKSKASHTVEHPDALHQNAARLGLTKAPK